LYVISVYLKAPSICHTVMNFPSIDLMVAVLSPTQAIGTISVIYTRFPADISTISSASVIPTFLELLRQLSGVPLGHFGLLRLAARHSGQLPFSDCDCSHFFLAARALNGREVMGTLGMTKIVIG
jgi:hypothetical protein